MKAKEAMEMTISYQKEVESKCQECMLNRAYEEISNAAGYYGLFETFFSYRDLTEINIVGRIDVDDREVATRMTTIQKILEYNGYAVRNDDNVLFVSWRNFT